MDIRTERNSVHILENSDPKVFTNDLKKFLDAGFELKACNCGFIDSAEHNFCSSYQAILVRQL